RNFEMNHDYHKELHNFTQQIERILLAVILILFGGSLVSGVLDKLTWGMALGGIAYVFLIRPVTGLMGLIGTHLTRREKGAVSFFGIKGVGSFFYLAFALDNAGFQYESEIWAFVAFVVLISILIHGLTAPWTMKKLKLRYVSGEEAKPEEA